MYGDFKLLVPNFFSGVIKIEGKKEAFVGVFDVMPRLAIANYETRQGFVKGIIPNLFSELPKGRRAKRRRVVLFKNPHFLQKSG